MATKIDANTNLYNWLDDELDLAKQFNLTYEEHSLVMNELLKTEEDMLAHTSLFKLGETGVEWFREELQYIIDKLEPVSNNELATSASKKISKYLN